MTYKERVKEIATEMAMMQYPDTFTGIIYSSVDEAFVGQEQEYLIKQAIPFAVIAVKYMAEMIRDVLSITTDYRDEVLQEELVFRGLIPSKE